MTENVETFDHQECKLEITGKHLELGEALQGHIKEKFQAFCSSHKYKPTTTYVSVEHAQKADHSFTVAIDMHIFQKDLHVSASNGDALPAVHAAFHSLAEQVKKVKDKDSQREAAPDSVPVVE